jgi:hypothetical protein
MTLDDATDRLYGVALDEFVPERTRLAKELRDAGNREEADAVSKLRKPTVPAWALNQLARSERRDVDLLLDAGHRLREAQAGVLRGEERDAFERARKTESDALKRLLREAEQLLGGNASAAALNQIRDSLRAAAVSDEGRELLARGRFVKPLEATTGFELVAGLAGSTPPARRKPETGKAEARRRAQEALRDARARLREAEAEARTAAREVDRLRAELDRAEAAAEDAEARVESAQHDVDEAKRALEG